MPVPTTHVGFGGTTPVPVTPPAHASPAGTLPQYGYINRHGAFRLDGNEVTALYAFRGPTNFIEAISNMIELLRSTPNMGICLGTKIAMLEEELFHRALEKPTLAEQLAFLDQVCVDQPEVRQRVERLLRSHELVSFPDALAGFVEVNSSSSLLGVNPLIRKQLCPCHDPCCAFFA